MFAISQKGASYITAVYDITDEYDNGDLSIVDALCVSFINTVNTTKGMTPIKAMIGQLTEQPVHDLLSRGLLPHCHYINTNMFGGDCYFYFYDDISDKDAIAAELNDKVYRNASSTADKGGHSLENIGEKLASLHPYLYLFEDRICASREMEIVFENSDKLGEYTSYFMNSLHNITTVSKMLKDKSDEYPSEKMIEYCDNLHNEVIMLLYLIDGTRSIFEFAKVFNKVKYAVDVTSHDNRLQTLYDKCESVKKKVRLLSVIVQGVIGKLLSTITNEYDGSVSDLRILCVHIISPISKYKGLLADAIRAMRDRESFKELIYTSDDNIIKVFGDKLYATFKYMYAEKFLEETWEDPTRVESIFKEYILKNISLRVYRTIDAVYGPPIEGVNSKLGGYWFDINTHATMGFLREDFS